MISSFMALILQIIFKKDTGKSSQKKVSMLFVDLNKIKRIGMEAHFQKIIR